MNEKDCTFYKSVLLRSVVGSHRYEEEQAKGRELSISEDWVQFKMLYDKMELPTQVKWLGHNKYLLGLGFWGFNRS